MSMKQTIVFHSNQLSIRGTEIALFDYARYNEEILSNNSLIFYNADNKNNHPDAITKFKNRFQVVGYKHTADLDRLLIENKATLLYAIKAGKNDGLIAKTVPTMVHAVFPTHPSQMHGASYAFISEWLSKHCSNYKIPCVPHIVDLPHESGDLRQALKIPVDAKVLGTYGGSHSFDVACAIQAMHKVLERSNNTYFIFLNIEPFTQHPRALFLPGTTDVAYKVRFINTCDAMLHARLQGESFGLACAEFSIKNKPVITYTHNKHTHHHDVLGDKGFFYTDANSLVRIIESLDPAALKTEHWDQYSARYNKQIVMELFDQHLIQPALRNPRLARPQINIGWKDTLPYYKLKLKMRFGV